MALRDADMWMWSEACALLARAERLHSQFFQLQRSAPAPAWEPPVDVLETEQEVVVLAALPGVGPDRIQAAIEGGELVIVGVRHIPQELRQAAIHRLELPHGRFARRLPLPAGHYDSVQHAMVDGCLVIRLHKASR